MSSSPQTTTRTTGAYRAHRDARDRAAARTLAQRPPARYEPYLDGLFTYCLSVLCDHDAATAALGDALAFAERRGHRGPQDAADHRAWLYALARWACLRKLAEAKRKRRGGHAADRPGDGRRHGTRQPAEPSVPAAVQERHRGELAQLAWPEAAGTTPEQREALELAVRHHLAVREVAAVLGKDPEATRDLLASAACEVERTRAALAVAETDPCPGVARLTGDRQQVLGTALRQELVRHVDDCPRCRRTAAHAIPGRWPGTTVTPDELPVLPAPRAALHAAMARFPRARSAFPRLDRRGFPMDPRDRAARRDRLRARAVTTTVVATVVAAPVFAVWAAYRGTPAGEGEGGRSVGAGEAHGPDVPDGAAAGDSGNAENTGSAPGVRFRQDGGADVSVAVVSVTGTGGKGTGRLAVTAAGRGDTTLITLTATGRAPVDWSAATGAAWLYLSRSSGTLRPGESLTIKVYVDQLREPSGPWTARVALSPAGAVVTIRGYGTAPGTKGPGRPAPRPGNPAGPTPPAPEPAPTTSAPSEPGPPPSPSPPAPAPEPAGPSPTDGTGGSPPPPGDGGGGGGDGGQGPSTP
ncbi:BACON domain-containing protein [Streptomyces sp. enrichment culture]|uniref:BACON domain-containing protein n=1 Tax=Streptomyces sp. enrichment culture TaxID=1795815 RepID=UPI003F54B456